MKKSKNRCRFCINYHKWQNYFGVCSCMYLKDLSSKPITDIYSNGLSCFSACMCDKDSAANIIVGVDFGCIHFEEDIGQDKHCSFCGILTNRIKCHHCGTVFNKRKKG